VTRVLVAGCGYLGSALARRLTSAGDLVFGLRRRGEGLPPGIVPIATDLGDRAAVAAALDRIGAPLDAVAYTAAAERSDDDAYRRAYVDGLGVVLAALRARRARPVVLFTSSTSVYAQDDGSWVDEESPAQAAGFRGARMREAEALLAASGLPACALRLGGIYGPGRTRLVESVRSGRAAIRPGPPHFGNRIHRDDAAGSLAHLLARALAGAPLPPLLLGVDDEPADDATVLRWLASRLGVDPPASPDGFAAAGAGTGAGSGKRCSNARLRATGYRLAYPTFREGYGALIDAGARGDPTS
jgi:nucleoside-diphosphate-sugar epimerase